MTNDERREFEILERENDYKELLRNPSFLRFARKLLADNYVTTTTFSTDPLSSAFFEGHRNCVLRIFADIQKYRPDVIAFLLSPSEPFAQEDIDEEPE